MADNKSPISQEEFDRLTEQIADVADIKLKETLDDYRKGLIDFNKVMKELSRVYKNEKSAIQEKVRQELELINALKARKEYIKKVTKDELQKSGSGPTQQKPGFWQRGSEQLDWNLDRRINGLNSILSGNFKYGSLQILQSFQKGRALIGHPMVQFGLAAAKLGFALNDFSTKTDRLANKIAGGSLVSPESKNRKWEMSYQDTVMTMMYGQNKKDFYDYKINTFGAQTKAALSKDPRFSGVWAQGRAALQDFGANPDLMNSFLQQEIAIGRTSQSMEKFNYKLIKSLQGLDKLGSTAFVQNLVDLNKTLLANNINGLANAESLRRFQDQLNKGTLTVADFTRGLTARRQSSTSTLAGVGAMLAERGLGGKELQEAYSRGDMIAVAGAVRRGGIRMQRDIEKIAPEIAREMGTSDIREAIALQSETPWGSFSGDLKNMEVQNLLVKGGSLTIALEGKDTTLNKIIKDREGKEITEEEDFKNIDKEIIKTTVDNTNALKSLTNLLEIGGLNVLKDFEKDKIGTLANISGYLNPITAPVKIGKAIVEFSIGNPTQTK